MVRGWLGRTRNNMQTYSSNVKVGSPVTFPEWRGERHYMIPFTVGRGLIGDLGRYQTTVNQMMDGVLVDPNQQCYLMVDEKEVTPGNFHRRPGLHVDGYWNPGTKGYGGHGAVSCHGGQPYWSPTPTKHSPVIPSHQSPQPTHGAQSISNIPEGLILASNYTAARAITGEYSRDFVNDWRGGDCSDLSIHHFNEVVLKANQAYHMDVMTLHESLPITENVRRTVVRINVPNWKN